MLLGVAAGMIAGVAVAMLVTAPMRPDIVIGLVVGGPGGPGMLLVLLSRRPWITALGAFLLALAPGWLGVLVLLEAVGGG